MKLLGAAMCVGLALYLLLNVILGPVGLREMQRLEAHKERIQENVDKLQKTNSALTSEVAELRTSPSEIRKRARKLGYYDENEEVIRFEGWNHGTQTRTAGREVRPFQESRDASSLIRSTAAAGALLTLIVLLILERIRNSRPTPERRSEGSEDSSEPVNPESKPLP
jgi:cell division protein FtsB